MADMDLALLELVSKVEAAAEPDRGIDALIHLALNPDSFRLPSGADQDSYGDAPDVGDVVSLRGFVGAVVSSPPYSASLDSAVGVVPPDYSYTVSWIGIDSNPADARVWLPSQKGDGVSADCHKAATAALALCAAALRARATLAAKANGGSHE